MRPLSRISAWAVAFLLSWALSEPYQRGAFSPTLSFCINAALGLSGKQKPKNTMKKLILFVLPLLAMAFNSCSKNDDGGKTGSGATALVKTMRIVESDGEESESHAYQYDDQQRVIKDIASYGTATVTYSNNKVTVTWSGDYGYTQEYTLNDEGYVTQYKSGGYTESYTYTNGYLTKVNGEDCYTWANGNLINEIDYAHTYTNKPDNLSIDIQTGILKNYFLIKFKGTCSKNLPSKSVRYYGTVSEGNIANTYNYSYTFNSSGNPTEVRVTGDDTTMYITYY